MTTLVRREFIFVFLIVSSLNMLHIAVQPDDCHCGSACSFHGPIAIAEAAAREPYHRQCPPGTCSSCDAERGSEPDLCRIHVGGANPQPLDNSDAIAVSDSTGLVLNSRPASTGYAGDAGTQQNRQTYLLNQSLLI